MTTSTPCLMDIVVNILSTSDVDNFSELIRVFEVVFEMDNFKIPDDKHLRSLLAKSDFLALVAKYDKKVVGGLTVHILDQYYSSKPMAYIYDVGVLKEYQRKGIGKKLISHLINYCKENGFENAYVEAEKEDIHAINFYRTTSISNELDVIHFTYLFGNDNK